MNQKTLHIHRRSRELYAKISNLKYGLYNDLLELRLSGLDLEDLEMDLSELEKLKSLEIFYCKGSAKTILDSVHADIQEIRLFKANLTNINLERFRNLKTISIYGCENFTQTFLDSASKNLRNLFIRNIDLENINLNRFFKLEDLQIDECKNLTQTFLDSASKNLRKLEISHVVGSKNLSVDRFTCLLDSALENLRN
jgi:hypothetical protein